MMISFVSVAPCQRSTSRYVPRTPSFSAGSIQTWPSITAAFQVFNASVAGAHVAFPLGI